MSHFTLAVITEGEPTREQLEEILAPFDEDKRITVVRTKEEIIKKERKSLGEYFETTYKKYLSDPEKYKESCTNEKHLEYLEKEFPKKLLWTDEEIYQDAIKYENNDSIQKDGSILDIISPNGKWDWWVVGGRWDGLIETKDGEETNSARIKDIVKENKETYAIKLREWELFIEESKPLNEEEENAVKWNFFLPAYYKEIFKTKEDYARLNSKFNTYAVLDKEGNWIEPGEMGWFGISHSKPEDIYNFMNTYEKLVFENAGENDWLTIIDCHI